MFLSNIMTKTLTGFFALLLCGSVSSATENVVVVPAQPQFLGKFLVRDITSAGGTHEGTVCQPYQDSDGQTVDADSRCGQNVLVYRSAQGDQIAFFQVPSGDLAPTDRLFNFSVFRGALLARNRQCDGSIQLKDLASTFDSRLCRGFLAANINNDGADHYVFYPNMPPQSGQTPDPSDEAAARMIVTGMLVGIPVGMSSAYDIEVPRTNLGTITINEELVGFALIVKSTIINKISLVRID